MALATPAWAQDSGSGDDGDIIVTARRTEEKLQDVPISITVLSQEAITKRNLINAGDLGNYVPSLATNANFGPEKSSFSIRGFIQEGRTSPSVGVYFADVVAPRANSGTTSGNGAGVGAFFDLENVQVLKGPQGTLFGRNTTGGAILLVPTKPKDRLEGFVEASVGNYNMHRVQAVLNAPLSDNVRVRGAIDWNQADGYLRNKSGIGPKALGNTNYVSARLSLVWDVTPDIENYTIGRYSKSDTYGNVPKIISAPPCATVDFCTAGIAGVGMNFNGLGPFLAPLAARQIARAQARGDDFWDVDNSDPDPKSIQTTWQVINTTTWKANDNLTVKNIISYAMFKEDTSYSLFGDNYLYPDGWLANFFFDGFPGFPAGRAGGIKIATGPSGDYANQATFTEELQLIGTAADGRLNWQAGAYLEVSKPHQYNSGFNEIFIECANSAAYQCSTSSFLYGFGLTNISTSSIKNFYNNKGLYAQATYKISDKFSVTGGIRYTMDRMRDESRNINTTILSPGTAIFVCQDPFFPGTATGPNGPGCETRDVNTGELGIKISSNRPTWLIGLDYYPNPDLHLYAKYSRGYRQGSIISGNFASPTFEPEKVDTFEIGAKTSFRGAMPGYFNIAAFYNDFSNQQIAVNTVIAPDWVSRIAPSQIIANAGKSRIWGIEIDASVRPFAGFKLDASYAYLNTRLVSITPPPLPEFYSQLIPVAEVGGPLAQSPKNRLTLTATYKLPLSDTIGDVSVGATYTHTDANEVHTQFFAPTQFKVPAQDQLNLNVGWESVAGTPMDLSFFMTNVTNEKRVVYPIATYQTTGAESVYLNMPRMWGFRLKYRFGD
ncbi:MAG: TonB-dependent receptor [Novosphingobium sp.]